MAETAPTTPATLRATVAWGVTRRLGGPLGAHRGRFAKAWPYLLATLSWVICMVRQVPCRADSGKAFVWMCYTDLTALYYRGDGLTQATGGLPYANVQWEYPVLTGYFVTFANWLSSLFGAVTKPGVDGAQLFTNGYIYFAVNAVLLFGCLLWIVASVLRLARGRSGLAIAVAISPTIWATGLINWDLFAVALTMAGLVAWTEKKHPLAGVWWGLAIAAKFYPLVIVGALVVVALRPDILRKGMTPGTLNFTPLRRWATMAGAAAATWLVVNLPIMITHFDGWKLFYTFNSDRGADLGSFWYGLQLAGVGTTNPIFWSRAFMILGYVGLAALIFLAPVPPKPVEIAFLAVAIMVAGNLVYSPQYVLWTLPLVVLARPKRLDYVVFTVAELTYYLFIWWYLGGRDLEPGPGRGPFWYIVSIFLRVGATLWLMGRVAWVIRRRVPAEAPPPVEAPPPAVAVA
ncbi:MAG: glycosyltransferase 87 family protein [Propionibacteriaceae bacterium]|jgi:hypothetical protein|nr:glycosyltransferase 87 family protein [Propionibacteriaceae bacterium]